MVNIKIAGSAVAVERIFSGGQDTISLQRASLRPETIQTLMLVKQHLRVMRRAIDDLIVTSNRYPCIFLDRNNL